MTETIATLMSVALALTIMTNIIVQAIKGLTYDKVPTNLLAFITAFVVTGAAFFIWVSVAAITVKAYMIVATIGMAFAVAMAAMFGFDKLRELVDQWLNIKQSK